MREIIFIIAWAAIGIAPLLWRERGRSLTWVQLAGTIVFGAAIGPLIVLFLRSNETGRTWMTGGERALFGTFGLGFLFFFVVLSGFNKQVQIYKQDCEANGMKLMSHGRGDMSCVDSAGRMFDVQTIRQRTIRSTPLTGGYPK